MVRKPEPVKFGCSKCGRPIEAYPPDSYYTLLDMEPCKEGDSKKIEFICDNWGASNIRYWDRHHAYFASI